MQSWLCLYLIIPNKETLSYDILSEHPDRYEECSTEILSDIDLDTQIDNLYLKYMDLDPQYIKFIHLKPYIQNNKLYIPIYCLIPYNSHEIKNSYKISCSEHAKFIPNLRKILNII